MVVSRVGIAKDAIRPCDWLVEAVDVASSVFSSSACVLCLARIWASQLEVLPRSRAGIIANDLSHRVHRGRI